MYIPEYNLLTLSYFMYYIVCKCSSIGKLLTYFFSCSDLILRFLKDDSQLKNFYYYSKSYTGSLF